MASRESAAEGELATAQEVIKRGLRLGLLGRSQRSRSRPWCRPSGRGNRRGGGGRRPSSRAKPDRPVEEPQALGRVRPPG